MNTLYRVEYALDASSSSADDWARALSEGTQRAVEQFISFAYTHRLQRTHAFRVIFIAEETSS